MTDMVQTKVTMHEVREWAERYLRAYFEWQRSGTEAAREHEQQVRQEYERVLSAWLGGQVSLYVRHEEVSGD